MDPSDAHTKWKWMWEQERQTLILPWLGEKKRVGESWGFPGGTSGKEPACQCRRHMRCGLNPNVGKTP